MLDETAVLLTNATNHSRCAKRKSVRRRPRLSPGITEGHLDLARQLGNRRRPRGDFSLTELYTADEAFTTGTMGGLVHIAKWTATIGTGPGTPPGPVTQALQDAYAPYIPFTPCSNQGLCSGQLVGWPCAP